MPHNDPFCHPSQLRQTVQTDHPTAIGDYDILSLNADIVGLVDSLGERQAVVVGHDWGAAVAWHCALLQPDLFRALGLLSVPFLPRTWSDPRPTDARRVIAGDGEFYQLYFQDPGRAEAELDADIRRSLTMFLYAASGDAPPEKRWRYRFAKGEKLLDTGGLPDVLPNWLTEADLDQYTNAFAAGGFRGPLNWYRNLDRMWELTRFLCGARVRQPSRFAAGSRDAMVEMYHAAYLALDKTMPNLRSNTLLDGAGHWVNQERAADVNWLLIEFLRGL